MKRGEGPKGAGPAAPVYVADNGTERLHRDLWIFRIYEGTSQVQQTAIARETMKRGG